MCLLCGTSIPVCNLAGGCGPQTLDYLKIVIMSLGAGGGVLGGFLISSKENKNKDSNGKNKK
jgi:hypothetical protein